MNIKIKQFASKVSTCILSPITQNPAFFICQLLIMIVPFALYNFAIGYNYKGVIVEIIRVLHIFIFDAYFISLLLLFTHKIINSDIVKIVFYTFTIGVCAFHSFVITTYQTQITPLIIRLIRETNWMEIKGFISTLNSSNFTYTIVLIITITIFIFLAERLINKEFVNQSKNINIGGGYFANYHNISHVHHFNNCL